MEQIAHGSRGFRGVPGEAEPSWDGLEANEIDLQAAIALNSFTGRGLLSTVVAEAASSNVLLNLRCGLLRAVEVVGRTLGMGRRDEDGALVLVQDPEPG